ncbi:MAG: efflux transporter outer membrane subunit [Rhodanobacteraceae bacterium]
MTLDSTAVWKQSARHPPVADLARRIFAVLPLMLIASCMVGPNYRTPASKVADAWTVESTPAINAGEGFEEYWWKSLDDPVLDRLIEVASGNNLSLQIAGVRILQARAQLNKAIGNLFPQQQALSGSVDYTRLGDGTAFLPGFTPNLTTDQILFAATWEMDIWGKYRRGIESDQAAFISTVASYDDALVTLISDVASTYVSIRTAEQRISVANTNITNLEESLRVATARFQAGETSQRDVQQAQTVLSQTQASIPQLENSARQSKNALAVLIGETPDRVDEFLKGSDRIPTAPASVTVGIPRDLLRRRPDVREAGFTAASQSALIGVAKATMYPSFSLSGAFGFSSTNEGSSSLGDLFNWDQRAVKGGASFVFPIFNYGRLVNAVRVQDAQFQQAVLNYQNTVLVAQQEVENGLSAFTTAQTSLTHLVDAAASGHQSTELAMAQYKAGETDYTTVLSAEQSELSIDDSLASAQGNVVQGLIAVYRALGGGWEIRNGKDVVSDEVKSEMAERTNWGDLLEPAQHLPAVSPEAEPNPAAAESPAAGNREPNP